MRRPPEERLDRRGVAGDPPRWGQSAGGTAVEKSLASGVRALPEPGDLDDLRLAQIRNQILHQAPSAVRGPVFNGWSWARTAAFALAFLLLGGITTAMAARLYIRRLERTTVPTVAASGAAVGPRGREKPRRWRMAVRQPAELEVSSGPEGTEIAVVDGRAEISGAELTSPLTLTPGTPWSPGATDVPGTAAGAADGHRADQQRPNAAVARAKVEAAPPTTNVVAPPPVSRRTARLALLTPRGPSSPPTPTGAAPVAPTAGPAVITTPATPLEPLPFPAPSVVGDRSRGVTPVPHAPSATPPESPAEAFLVAAALRSLRSDHAPSEALAKLEEHQRRFPHGALGREAALARVEALLGLGRNDEARNVLDSLSLGPTGADRRARLARAELRADRGDCVGAVDDLDQLLAGATNDDVAARALYRRARCALRSRNLETARIDLRDYRSRFPDGPRKMEVEALLRRLGE